MKVTWLGQAGLLFEKDDFKIIVDPYLSNYCFKVNPASDRRMPIDDKFLDIPVDVFAVTHNHIDHLDPETAPHYLEKENSVVFLGPFSAWDTARKACVNNNNNNFVMFNRHTTWTEGDITFTAVKAEHSDREAIGIIIDDGEKKYYITGDTLYNEEVFEDLPDDIYAVFLPINGKGNNMNIKDAEEFAKRVNAQKVVPVHWGMMDSLDPKEFKCPNSVIPEIYKEINL